MKQQENGKSLLSRRNILKGATTFLIGGAAGYLGKASSVSAAGSMEGDAPALPWPWVKLDPLEAGRRAYRGYLEHKG